MNASEPIVLHFTFFLYLFYRPHQNYHSVENKGKFVNRQSVCESNTLSNVAKSVWKIYISKAKLAINAVIKYSKNIMGYQIFPQAVCNKIVVLCIFQSFQCKKQ